MIETLWPQILANKFTIQTIENNKKITSNQIKTGLINTTKMVVQVYDSNGNVTGQLVKEDPISPNVFTTIELVQDWYYDATGNIVFNKIKEAILYAKKWTVDGQDKEISPILKIVFN